MSNQKSLFFSLTQDEENDIDEDGYAGPDGYEFLVPGDYYDTAHGQRKIYFPKKGDDEDFSKLFVYKDWDW